jgi:hypothetical protein
MNLRTASMCKRNNGLWGAGVVSKAVGLALAAACGASWATMDFSGIPYVLYGDGESFSLPISGLHATASLPKPGDDYYVNSSPGAIKNDVVIATGASGTGVTTNFDGMDKAYATPSGVSGSNFYTTTNTANDPCISGGSINNNYATTWDASLLSLKTFLNGEAPISYFNNNQENSLTDAAAQTLAAWAQLWVTDDSGALVGDVLEFTNRKPPPRPELAERILSYHQGPVVGF